MVWINKLHGVRSALVTALVTTRDVPHIVLRLPYNFLVFILQWYIVYIVNKVLALGLSDWINAQRAPYIRTVIL